MFLPVACEGKGAVYLLNLLACAFQCRWIPWCFTADVMTLLLCCLAAAPAAAVAAVAAAAAAAVAATAAAAASAARYIQHMED
jgi:uncharacterized protein (DUF2147 family)